MTDIADLFAPPPPGPAQTTQYRQGRIITFDPVTLANTVDVGGAILSDLPILGVGEATLLTAGSVVGLLNIGDASKTMAIIGRLVYPGTDQAADATALLSANTYAATIGVQEGTPSTDYTDLDTVGPTVVATVRGTGRLLVTISFGIQGLADTTFGGSATVQMSGANNLTADDVANNEFFFARHWHGLSGGIVMAQQDAPCASKVFEGLTPGVTVIQMKYKSIEGGVPDADFSRRTLNVVAL